jgi:hypothetical protein
MTSVNFVCIVKILHQRSEVNLFDVYDFRKKKEKVKIERERTSVIFEWSAVD